MILPVSNICAESLWINESKINFALVTQSRPDNFKVILGAYRIPQDCHILFCITVIHVTG